MLISAVSLSSPFSIHTRCWYLFAYSPDHWVAQPSIKTLLLFHQMNNGLPQGDLRGTYIHVFPIFSVLHSYLPYSLQSFCSFYSPNCRVKLWILYACLTSVKGSMNKIMQIDTHCKFSHVTVIGLLREERRRRRELMPLLQISHRLMS